VASWAATSAGSRTKNGREKDPCDGRAGGAAATGAGGAWTLLRPGHPKQAEAGRWRSWSREAEAAEGSGRDSGSRGGDDEVGGREEALVRRVVWR
jgi:hypothetical protein